MKKTAVTILLLMLSTTVYAEDNNISKSKVIKTDKEVSQVGTIASNGDAEVGKMISSAMQKVGKKA